MKSISNTLIQKNNIGSILINLGALAFIYLVPTISHLMNFPLYLIEPMRLMLVFALVHTNKHNAYLLALTLPLFSYLISAHPFLPKMMLITFELSLNVFLFYFLVKRIKKSFPSILLSIILSKAVYYLIKFFMIKFAILGTGLISTPIYIQTITTLVFSIYLFLFFKKKKLEY